MLNNGRMIVFLNKRFEIILNRADRTTAKFLIPLKKKKKIIEDKVK